MSAEWNGEAAGHMMLEEPENAYKLLRGFMMLIGESRPWWRATEYGEHTAWPSAIKAAINEMARVSHVPAKWFAWFLDVGDCPRARARVLLLATEKFKRGIR